MFSGIVQAKGVVSQLQALDNGARMLTIAAPYFLPTPTQKPIQLGDSVCVSGVCLTVVEIAGEELSFELSSETLRVTTLPSWQIGREVNLELSLRFGDRIDGHFVQGHVDGVSEVLNREEQGATIRLKLTLPTQIQSLVTPKGAITLDGVSLTVGEVEPESFSVYIILHTASVTTLKHAKAGSLLNVEADSMARYVVSITENVLRQRGL